MTLARLKRWLRHRRFRATAHRLREADREVEIAIEIRDYWRARLREHARAAGLVAHVRHEH